MDTIYEGIPEDGDTFSDGRRTYVFSKMPTKPNEILLGATAQETADNLNRFFNHPLEWEGCGSKLTFGVEESRADNMSDPIFVPIGTVSYPEIRNRPTIKSQIATLHGPRSEAHALISKLSDEQLPKVIGYLKRRAEEKQG